MPQDAAPRAIVTPSKEIAALVRLAARVASGPEAGMRAAAAECVTAGTPVVWVEEAILQSYLFCGFPRTLNAMREWRRVSGVEAPPEDPGAVGGAGRGDLRGGLWAVL
jgi:hypothetical protein